MPQQRYAAQDIAARGRALFEDRIQTFVKDRPSQDFVAIDIDSGDYEVGAAESEVLARLQARHPEAQTYIRRVGIPYAHRIGVAPGNLDPFHPRWKRPAGNA